MGYQGLLDRVRDVGLGLKEMGVGARGQEFFNIYGQTRWVVLGLGLGSDCSLFIKFRELTC